jgi:SAM-dependent methyltransferase
LTFAVIDGAPVLLDPSSVFACPESQARHYEKRRTSRLRDFIFRITPDLELRVGNGARCLERAVLELGRERAQVLNIGGKHRAAAARGLRSRADVEILELDFSLSTLTHVVADPQRLPLPDDSFDVVVIDAVLEHLPDPAAATEEIARVLRSNGIVFADTPFMLPVHGGPFDFGRFSFLAHRRLFARFDEIESGISSGPAMALSWSIQQFLLSFVRSQFGRYAVKLSCRLGLFWLKYADLYLQRREAAYDGALAFFFLGRKAAKRLTDHQVLSGYRGNTPSLLGAGRPKDPL